MRAITSLLAVACAACLLSGCSKPPPPPTTQLKVASTPAGAAVFMDGQLLGKTPLQKAVPPGSHLLELSLEGHDTVVERFQCRAPGEQVFAIPLRPIIAPVLVESKPAGAALSIAGEDKGKTPVLVPQLRAGDYDCTLTADGFATKKFRITVANARPQRIVMPLDSVTGEVRILSETPQTEVLLNDKPYGVTAGSQEPLVLQNIVAGEYALTARKEGYKPYNQQIVVKRQENLVVNVPALSGLPGTVEVVSVPPGAEVCNARGDQLGTTPCRIAELPAGTTALTFRRKGYEETTRNVLVTAGAEQQVNVTLVRSLGDITFATVPPGVSVTVDTQPAGKTGADAFSCTNLPPGRHILSLQHPDYETYTRAIVVEKGQATNLGVVKLKKRWVPTHALKLANGATVNGVLVSKETDGSVVFESNPGIKTTYNAAEVLSVTPLEKPGAPAPPK
jgi:hypothetical protein